MWVAILGIFFGIVQFPSDVGTAEVPAAFNCKNTLIADEWRKVVLNFHNERRRKVASGEERDKAGTIGPAKNMNELAWDCDLEDQATEAAKECKPYGGGTYGANEKTFKANPCNITTETGKVLREWWNEVHDVELVDRNKYSDDVKHFGLMAFHENTVIGCSYSKCTGGINLLCLHQRKAPKVGRALFAKGDFCGSCPDKCENKLCQPDTVKYIGAPITCADDGLTDDMTATALNLHNYYRRVIATGWAMDKKIPYAPRAAKMNALEYKCDPLGKDALAKITNCEWPVPAADAGRPQNTHKIDKNWEISGQDALETAISAWYKELEESGGIGEKSEYTQQMADAGKLSNFVNLAYEENTQTYYRPLVPDEMIYTTGKTCSKCAENTRKCETDSGNNGLCIT
ncbi:hypothetical protein Aduo_007288 [Ancylostoma duodenale]